MEATQIMIPEEKALNLTKVGSKAKADYLVQSSWHFSILALFFGKMNFFQVYIQKSYFIEELINQTTQYKRSKYRLIDPKNYQQIFDSNILDSKK